MQKGITHSWQNKFCFVMIGMFSHTCPHCVNDLHHDILTKIVQSNCKNYTFTNFPPSLIGSHVNRVDFSIHGEWRVWEKMKSPVSLLLDPISLQWRQISTQNPNWASPAGDPFDMRAGLIPLVLAAAMSSSFQPGALSLTFDSHWHCVWRGWY